MRHSRATALFCLALSTGSAAAASLQVTPVNLEVPAPGRASTLTVRNMGETAISAQVRVFRWTQHAGVEKLEPTQDVVASPPFVELRPRQDYALRVIRLAGQPVSGEEAYRVVIDELPKPRTSPGTVALVLRHVVPLFFSGRESSPASPEFAVRRRGNDSMLEVRNRGESRVRLSAITVRDSSGRSTPLTQGLLGYALAQSSMQWRIPGPATRVPLGARISISGVADGGPFNATSIVTAAD
jgi:fimbrial chaperone protein